MSQKVFSYGAGVLFAAAGAACWSMAGGLVRLTEGVDAWQIVFYRSAVVLVSMFLWLGLRFRGAFWAKAHDAGVNAVIAGVAIGTAGLVFIISMFYTTVADAVFMTGVAPFLSAILGLWILRERIPGITWFAMSIALVGMAIIFYGNAGGGAFVGTLLALYSAFCFSCYAVMLRWGQKTEMSVALIWNAIFLVAVTGVIILLPTALRDSHGLQDFAIGWRNFGLCFVMGAVQLTLGLILFTIGSRSVPAAQLALIALVEPTLSPLWAWLASGELPPIWTFVGGAVIVAAIVIQALFASRTKRHARQASFQRTGQPAFDHP